MIYARTQKCYFFNWFERKYLDFDLGKWTLVKTANVGTGGLRLRQLGFFFRFVRLYYSS